MKRSAALHFDAVLENLSRKGVDPMARYIADCEQIRDGIRDYVSGVLAKAGRSVGVRDDDDLLHLLDSLQLLRMVLELESRYAVSIENAEMTPENLGTIQRIAAFVGQKWSADAGGYRR